MVVVGGLFFFGFVFVEEKVFSSLEDVVSVIDYDFCCFFVYVLVFWLWLWWFWDCVLNFYWVLEGVVWCIVLWMFLYFLLVICKLNLGVLIECFVFY